MGLAAPNPSVGALVVKNGVVVGRGVTAPGGRPHAEPLALAEAGDHARGATLYVTLEPCSHHGRSPPCVDAVLRSGVDRVVVALGDPDPRVAGRGLAQLRAAGLDVVEGVAAGEARRDHLGHVLRVTAGRPAVTVKMAQTADGFAGAPAGQPRLLITGPQANAAVQMMRATNDAILVGRGTATSDNPWLTVRLPGLDQRKPLRIVLDPSLMLPLDSHLVRTALGAPVLVLTGAHATTAREQALQDRGVSVFRLPVDAEGLDLGAVLGELGLRGVTRVLCEGGPRLASRLVAAGFADRVVLLTGESTLGRPGLRSFTSEAAARVSDEAFYKKVDERRLGPDLMRVYETA